MPPFHPNCRCTTTVYFEDDDLPGERMMRDDKGKSVKTDYMNYDEWKKKYVDKADENGYNKDNKEFAQAYPFFVNKSDKLYEYSKNIKPLKDYEDIVCHGDGISFTFKDLDGNESNISVKEFVDILLKSGTYKGGNIRLITCNAGAKDGVVAQALANMLKVNVLAPSDVVNVYMDGELKVDNGGEWVLFKPKK